MKSNLPQGIFTLLILVTKWNLHFGSIPSTIAQPTGKRFSIHRRVGAGTSFQWLQNLSSQCFGIDIFKDDGPGRQLNNITGHFFSLCAVMARQYNEDNKLTKSNKLKYFSHATYISGLNSEFDVISQFERVGNTFGFRKVEEYLANDVAPFNKAETLLERADHSLVTNRVGRILQTDVTSSQVTATVR